MYILPIQQSFINKFNISQRRNMTFCSNKLQNDMFEKHPDNTIDLSIYSPFSNSYCTGNVKLDLENPCIFELPNTEESETPLIIDYDPSRRGTLVNKRTGNPFRVNILKTSTENFPDSVGFHFMSTDLKRTFGYVQLYKPHSGEKDGTELTRDYKDIGLVGDRVEVLYLRNYNDSKIGGVGKLADKMAVKYCIQEGIEPNIVSYADTGSHVAHYKRGKRFIEPQKGSDDWNFLKEMYGKTNPNSILDDLIKKAKSLNMRALALTDRTIAGALEFYQKCKANDIKPIIGQKIGFSTAGITLLCKDFEAYKILCRDILN